MTPEPDRPQPDLWKLAEKCFKDVKPEDWEKTMTDPRIEKIAKVVWDAYEKELMRLNSEHPETLRDYHLRTVTWEEASGPDKIVTRAAAGAVLALIDAERDAALEEAAKRLTGFCTNSGDDHAAVIRSMKKGRRR